jgi:hypothetical protein
MDALKQNIAEIDSAIIEARQWLREAKTQQEIGKQAQLAEDPRDPKRKRHQSKERERDRERTNTY